MSLPVIIRNTFNKYVDIHLHVNVNHHGGHIFEIAMFSVIPKEPILVVLTQTGNKRRARKTI